MQTATNKENAMLTNAQMTANRYARWAMARRKLAWIKDRLSAGQTVYLVTAYRSYKITRQTVNALSVSTRGLEMINGKSTLCMDGCKLTAQ
jgi:hypothetical protein